MPLILKIDILIGTGWVDQKKRIIRISLYNTIFGKYKDNEQMVFPEEIGGVYRRIQILNQVFTKITKLIHKIRLKKLKNNFFIV